MRYLVWPWATTTTTKIPTKQEPKMKYTYIRLKPFWRAESTKNFRWFLLSTLHLNEIYKSSDLKNVNAEKKNDLDSSFTSRFILLQLIEFELQFHSFDLPIIWFRMLDYISSTIISCSSTHISLSREYFANFILLWTIFFFFAFFWCDLMICFTIINSDYLNLSAEWDEVRRKIHFLSGFN